MPRGFDDPLDATAAAHVSWANTSDPAARTEPARRAHFRRFEDRVDPDWSLPEEERERRAKHLRKAYMLKLAAKSARARRKK